MRIGAYVEGFHNPEEWAQMHLDREYGAAYWPWDAVDHTADDAAIEAYLAAAKRNGLLIAEVGAWRNILNPDASLNEENMNYVTGQLKLADRVGARCCVDIAGTLNAREWDGPHPENLTDRIFGVTVEAIQQIIDSASPKNTYYTVEPMPWLFPYDIPSMHRLIKAVNRSAFAVHVDMCNMINSFDKVYNSGELTRAFFREFAPLIRSVHAKDTRIDDTLTIFIAEAIPGQGVFDYETLLTECSKLDADLPVMAEHLHSPAEYEQATDYIKNKARQLGLHFITGR